MSKDIVSLDRWTTRYGLIMAMAGNAVGLGNFLRFPAKAEPYGAAFMIPYFVALFLLGIPLMWIEWSIGRRGGLAGHNSAPGMFQTLTKHPIAKYLGVLGILLPTGIGLYYVYIESWSLGYMWKTAVGDYWGQETTREAMRGVHHSYLGIGDSAITFGAQSYLFFVLALTLNMIVFSRGIAGGIELVAKYAMPLLLILGVVLVIRVLTLPPVDGRSAIDGLRHFWRLDLSTLSNPNIWIDATGQIFFTLSLGFGTIHTYASFLTRQDDVVLNGTLTTGTNEFVEIVFGSCIVVPAAVIFFGSAMTSEIVKGGTFDIGFYTLPVIFQELPGGRIFGTMWFALLFLAGLTSSICMFQPLQLFLRQELGFTKARATAFVGGFVFIFMQPVVLFMNRGVLDELDYWVGTYLLVVFAAIEAILFVWVFGMKQGWEEIHAGADMQIPRFYYAIMRYVTPLFVLVLLGWWLVQGLPPVLRMEGIPEENKPYLLATRIFIVVSFVVLCFAVRYAWRKRTPAAQ